MLVASGTISTKGDHAKPFRVVRVETSNSLDNADDTEKEASQEESSDSEDELEDSNQSEMVVVDPVVGGKEDTGKGVARQMTDNIGASVFRGIITKVSSWFLSGSWHPSIFLLHTAQPHP